MLRLGLFWRIRGLTTAVYLVGLNFEAREVFGNDIF